MSGQPHRNFAVRKFLGFAAHRELKAEVFGLGQRDQLGLEDPAPHQRGAAWPVRWGPMAFPRPTSPKALSRRLKTGTAMALVPINFRAPNCGAHGACSREFFDRKIAVRVATHCRRQAE